MKAPFALPVNTNGRFTLNDSRGELIANFDSTTDQERRYIVEAINFAGQARALLETVPDTPYNGPYRAKVNALLASSSIEPEVNSAFEAVGGERKIIIVMDGGLVQEVLSDHPGVDVAIIDYDYGTDADAGDILSIPQRIHTSDGDSGLPLTEKAHAYFEGREVDAGRVGILWAVIQAGPQPDPV